MRRPTLSLVLVLSLLCVLGPAVRANKSVPVSGTVQVLTVGDLSLIAILGFANCTFKVDASSDNTKVASVQFKTTAGKKQKVMIKAESPGMAMVTVSTKEGSVGGCQGFDFTFPVMVTPDTKALLKMSKQESKAANAEIKKALGELVTAYCKELKTVVDDAKSGEISLDDALDQMDALSSIVSQTLSLVIGASSDTFFSAIWNSPAAQGFSGSNVDLLGLFPGGCGEVDSFSQNLKKAAEKAKKVVERKIKKAYMQLEKVAKKQDETILYLFQVFLGFPLPITPTPLPTPMPQVQPPAPPKPLMRTWTSSGRMTSSPLTRLEIAGLGDAGGGQVTVKVEGPDGFESEMMVNLDAECGFLAEFGGVKPGNYTVTLTQGTNSSSFKTIAI